MRWVTRNHPRYADRIIRIAIPASSVTMPGVPETCSSAPMTINAGYGIGHTSKACSAGVTFQDHHGAENGKHENRKWARKRSGATDPTPSSSRPATCLSPMVFQGAVSQQPRFHNGSRCRLRQQVPPRVWVPAAFAISPSLITVTPRITYLPCSRHHPAILFRRQIGQQMTQIAPQLTDWVGRRLRVGKATIIAFHRA